MSTTSRPIVKKKSALCLVRLFRKNPEILSAEAWSMKMAGVLEDHDISVVGACATLLMVIAARNTEGFESCFPKLVAALERLGRARSISQDHTYYGIPSPWLQIRLMRCIQYFPPAEDLGLRKVRNIDL